MMNDFVIYSKGVMKNFESGKDITFDGMSYVGIEFLVCGGVEDSNEDNKPKYVKSSEGIIYYDLLIRTLTSSSTGRT